MRAYLHMAALAAILALAGPAAGRELQPPPAGPTVSPATDGEIARALAEAGDHLQRGEPDQACAVLEALTRKPAFEGGPVESRRAVWLLMIEAAHEARDRPRARIAAGQLTALPDAGGADWLIRARIARASGDTADGVRSLALVLRRFPDALADVSSDEMARWQDLALQQPDEDLSFEFADALLAHWRPQDPFMAMSVPRYAQVRGLLHRGETDRAIQAARLIDDPDTLIDMRADKRFDGLAAAGPELTDPKAAAQRRLAHVDALVRQYPRRLSGVIARAKALIDLDRADDALAEIEPAIARARQNRDAFDDTDDKLAWALDTRTDALRAAQRDDEALADLRAAARVPEHGQANVSQTLNLAAAELDLGRPGAALETIRAAPSDNVSAYGRGVILYIQACAAAELGDPAAADAAIDAIRALRLDGVRQLAKALMCRGDFDAAAALLIERLRDPVQRGAALASLQVTPPPDHPTPLQQARLARQATLRQRPDVQAAVAAVGRINTYAAEDLWPPRPEKTASSK